jgi:hypothetical protein
MLVEFEKYTVVQNNIIFVSKKKNLVWRKKKPTASILNVELSVE